MDNPDPIKFETDKKYAVILTRRNSLDGGSISVFYLLDKFSTPAQARSYIRAIHKAGNEYFICKGFCMGG